MGGVNLGQTRCRTKNPAGSGRTWFLRVGTASAVFGVQVPSQAQHAGMGPLNMDVRGIIPVFFSLFLSSSKDLSLEETVVLPWKAKSSALLPQPHGVPWEGTPPVSTLDRPPLEIQGWHPRAVQAWHQANHLTEANRAELLSPCFLWMKTSVCSLGEAHEGA